MKTVVKSEAAAETDDLPLDLRSGEPTVAHAEADSVLPVVAVVGGSVGKWGMWT